MDPNAISICVGGPSNWPNSPVEIPETQAGEPTNVSTEVLDLANLARNIINVDHLNGNLSAIHAVKPGCTFDIETSDGALHHFLVGSWLSTACCTRTSVDTSGIPGGGGSQVVVPVVDLAVVAEGSAACRVSA